MFEKKFSWILEKAAMGPPPSPPRLVACFPGRYTLRDGSEHACKTLAISPDSIAVQGRQAPQVGERVALYLEEWGHFEGEVALCFATGFTMNFEATNARRERIAMQLALLSRRHEMDGVELRRHERIVLLDPASTITWGSETFPCQINNISRSGALLATFLKVRNGEKLTIGRRTRAEVVRLRYDGFAVQFEHLLPAEIFDPRLKL